MPTNPCPACGKPMAAADINVAEGVGLCRACGKLSRLREIAEQPELDPKALTTAPPPGCSIEERPGGGRVVRASLRSPGMAVAALAVCLFWNGIVSVFVLIAISGLYTHFVGPLPHWFPAPGETGKKGNIGPDMPLGMTWFLCIFLIPFVTIGLIMIATFLTCVFGRVEIITEGPVGRVRTGFGPFKWARRFDPTQVRRVSQSLSSWQQNNESKPVVQIDADRVVKFGSMLEDRRREWVIAVLHAALIAKRPLGTSARL
jgi:hypothetical protein